MPIRLTPPGHNPGGPDGQGWNRVSLNAHIGSEPAQCALRPRRFPQFADTMRSTQHARWGGYGVCVRDDGDCGSCPLLRDHIRMDAAPGEDRVLFRIGDHDIPYRMAEADTGWDGPAEKWPFEELARLEDGWVLERGVPSRDEHGEFFWVRRTP
ncbi:hypothetical protein [Streptomonospora arabica]|uniref:Uncharacterized protein n=1 Tax=Streptomonospora arabica TaxID=412417 RepID=A0ABV9SSI7_9ACTN